MKICFLVYNIFTLGGIQRVVSVLANELSTIYDVDIICVQQGFKENRSIYNLNSSIRIIDGSKLYKKKIISKIISKCGTYINNETGILNTNKFCHIAKQVYFPKEIRVNFINYFNKENYDVIIGVEGFYSLLLGIISEELTAKLIGWQHNSYDAYFTIKGKYCWNIGEMYKKYIPKLDKYIVLTDYDKNKFKEIMKIESHVIYNPKSFESKEKSDVMKKQFLAAGRFNYQKGFDLLIESFYEFSKKNNDWNLVIVGEGEQKSKIENLINKYNLQKRIKIDNATNDIKKYFLDSSVLLLPSRWEGMPMIVLESFEMGVPVISYDITAAKQLITNNKEGRIVEKFDIKEFSEVMLQLTEYEERIRMSNI